MSTDDNDNKGILLFLESKHVLYLLNIEQKSMREMTKCGIKEEHVTIGELRDTQYYPSRSNSIIYFYLELAKASNRAKR